MTKIGISLCAEISSIDALNEITRVNMDGLILRVSAIEGQGFSFGIILPMDKAVSLGMLPLQFSTYAELDIIWAEHHIYADLAQSGYIRTAIS